VKKLLKYLNPLSHLGDRKYSYLFPLIVNILLIVGSEIYVYIIAKNPLAVGNYIIFANVAFIIYFAFREGLWGGYISSIFSIAYYVYIIYSRHYTGLQKSAGIDTIIILAFLYLLLASIIGWLKQRIDVLIENEAYQRRRLEAIIEQLPVGVIVTDNYGILQLQNKQVKKILGLKLPRGYTFGKDTPLKNSTSEGRVVTPQQAPLAQVLSGRPSISGKEYVLKNKYGKAKYIQVSASSIRNNSRDIIAAAEIISDVTSQKEIERQKDDFLNLASHELKTPLTSLKMFVDLQKREIESKNFKKLDYYNIRISDQVDRLEDLTSDLLDVSRIQTGKLRINIETLDIAKLVKDTLDGIEDINNTHELEVIGESQLVQADGHRIYQVLVNLINNAIKYSPDKNKVLIKFYKSKNMVVVSVQDFGIGISPEEQDRIFDRLYQVSDLEEKTFPGLGLGLYISKEIINLHHGKIWVKSTKGKGSTFYFSLPIAKKKGNI